MAAKATTQGTKGVRERKQGVRQKQQFEAEFTNDVWALIKKEGKFSLNEDGDPARRFDVVLSDYDWVEVPVEEREWSSDTEKALKADTTVFIQFDRKRGA